MHRWHSGTDRGVRNAVIDTHGGMGGLTGVWVVIRLSLAKLWGKIAGGCRCSMKPVVLVNDRWVEVEDEGKRCFWCGGRR